VYLLTSSVAEPSRDGAHDALAVVLVAVVTRRDRLLDLLVLEDSALLRALVASVADQPLAEASVAVVVVSEAIAAAAAVSVAASVVVDLVVEVTVVAEAV
jgi:hypothetical protein